MALSLLLPPFYLMLLLAQGYFGPVKPVFCIVHPVYLVLTLRLRWFYELETLEEVPQLRNGC